MSVEPSTEIPGRLLRSDLRRRQRRQRLQHHLSVLRYRVSRRAFSVVVR